MRQKFLITTLLMMLPFLIQAQDLLRYCDGREVSCTIEGTTDTTVWITYLKGKRKKEEIIRYDDDLFSLVYGDSNERVVYVPNPLDPQAFTIDQMRSYAAGAAFARRNYKAILPTAGAFTAGVGGIVFGFWGLLVPLTYDLGIGYIYPQPRDFRKEKLQGTPDDFFIFGYEDVARKRKGRRIFAASVAGVVSYTVYTYIMLKK